MVSEISQVNEWKREISTYKQLLKDMTTGPDYKYIYNYEQIRCGDEATLSITLPVASPPKVKNKKDYELMYNY